MKLKFIVLAIAMLQIFSFASERSILVYADEELKVEPDMAIINFVVSSKEKTPQDAKAQNSKLSSKVKKLLDKNNIEKQNIKIKSSTITAQNIYNSDGKIEKTFYVASENIEVALLNLSKENAFLDALTKLGIENIATKYQKSDIAQQLDLVMQKAINSAISKAKNISKSSNLTLGDVLEIEEIQTTPMYSSYKMATSSLSQELDGSDGVIDINAKVKVKFAIK